jgi:mono/diheme cytochrome c family protein
MIVKESTMKNNLIKYLIYLVVGGLILFGLIQLIPVDRSNPATTQEPKWSSPEARALVKQHCFQCHSNETEWPWYSYIAPASWLIKWDVVNGRQAFNFSEWDTNRGGLNEMIGSIQEGEMPPIQYTIFHPGSVMNAAQKQALIDALTSSLK